MKAVSLKLALAALGITLGGALGCETEAFCITDCPGAGGTSGGDGGNGGEETGGGLNFSGGGNGGGGPGSGGGGNVPDGGCQVTEICNGKDDTCNGEIDEGLDFADPQQCGTCDLNCRTVLQNVSQGSIRCEPPDTLDGKTPGKCTFTDCAPNFYDVDKDPTNGCEYSCVKTSENVTVDADNDDRCGVDDDCDGTADEDLNVCSDVSNCGACGNTCVVPNGTARCVSTATGSACDTSNTKCEVERCDPGWYAISGQGAGCWYQCTPSGPEICDGKDNDCDNLIDNADPDLEATLGADCQGSDVGECAKPTATGKIKCISTGTTAAVALTCCDKGSDDVTSTYPNLPPTGVLNGMCDAPSGPQVIRPGDKPEECNGLDDDCDGTVDDSPGGVGQVCGSNVGSCVTGFTQCVNGAPACAGATQPAATDACNGLDENCDGVIDGIVVTPVVACTGNGNCSGGAVCMTRASATDRVCALPATGVGADCNVPPDPPCVNAQGVEVACTPGAPRAPQPCRKGAFACVGQLVCQGGIGKVTNVDKCGEDSNCDGRLDNQPDFRNDIANCGSCGNDCRTRGAHVNWQCTNGQCTTPTTGKCRPGFIDCDSNANDCERACTPSGTEQCNGVDDNCNCQVDEGVTAPAPSQVCGVSGASSDPLCGAGNGTNGIRVQCTAARWQCTFPPGYCNQGNPPSCSTTADVCDGRDNNCNGASDESYRLPLRTQGYIGQPCASDDGRPPPGDGACKGTGTFQCNSTTTTACNAVKGTPSAPTELCDGIDNDCDGLVDETFNNKGTGGTGNANFVRPAVVQINTNVWMYQYEASRPSATAANPGSGSGFWCTGAACTGGVPPAPAGVTLDRTPSCSVQGRIPWFNVTPVEAEQTCQAMGGQLCSVANWQRGCQSPGSSPTNCAYGYAPRSSCGGLANYTSGPFCNLSPFDFDGSTTAANTDGLLVTGSPSLTRCYSPWPNNQANPPASGSIFDITGNLREITREVVGGVTSYPLMGGAFNTEAETGARCDFDFYAVANTHRFFDAGFRCCFTSNPTQ